jgi:hypothetical protein
MQVKITLLWLSIALAESGKKHCIKLNEYILIYLKAGSLYMQIGLALFSISLVERKRACSGFLSTLAEYGEQNCIN